MRGLVYYLARYASDLILVPILIVVLLFPHVCSIILIFLLANWLAGGSRRR